MLGKAGELLMVFKRVHTSLRARLSLVLLLLMLSAQGLQAQLPLYDQDNNDNWHLNPILSDEFDGSQLDQTKWHIQGTNDYYYSNFIGRAPSQFSTDNVRLEGGRLKIETRWDPNFDFSPNPGQGGLAYENITTAAVISKQQASHGYLEIRARASDAPVASAFWLLGNQAELDVYEHFGNFVPEDNPFQPDKTHLETEIWSSIRDWGPGGNGTPTWTDRRQLPFRVAGDFHVYGLEWDENYLNFHIDGQLLDSVTRTQVEANDPDGWTIDNPMRIWMDSETFPWHGVPSQADLPQDYEIDYIRVWHHEPTPNPTGLIFADDFSQPTLDLVWNTGGGFDLDTENENTLLSTFGANWGSKGDDVGILDSDIGYATFTVASDGSKPVGGNFSVGTETFQNTSLSLARIQLDDSGTGTYELVWNNSGVSQDFETPSGWAGTINGDQYLWIVNGETGSPGGGQTAPSWKPDVSVGDRATTFGFWINDATTAAVIDNFEIWDTLTPTSAELPGDYNGDGTVDAADYTVWRDGGPLLNETDNPGTVDAGDYQVWRANFGNSSSAIARILVGKVPEPRTLGLLLLGHLAWVRNERRQLSAISK